MNQHRNRDDFSRFLVHLTRDYGGNTSTANLQSMLTAKKIEARNAHCLFHKKIKNIGFSTVLQRKFNTVCFTEVPLNQIRHLTKKIKGRVIELKPHGLVFWKDDLLNHRANPAVYINATTKGLREFLLVEFDQHFENHTQYRSFCKKHGDKADSIIEYYSLINIFNRKVDFSWEREWRHTGDFTFGFDQLVAIIAPDPSRFRSRCKRIFSRSLLKQIDRIPVVSPDWNYEQLVEDLTQRLWANGT